MGELAIEQKHWTIEDLDRLPYDEWNRYEIIDGELLVTSAPHGDHQQTAFRIALALYNWSEEIGIGEVYEAAGVIFTIDNSVQPDVLWVSDERKARLYDEAGHFRGAPELVVEVLSSGAQNEKRGRETKRRAYEKYGVEEYWIADWRSRQLFVYRREQGELRLVSTLSAGDTLTSPLLPGFTCPLERIFRA